ncbi:hypothetical protein CR513_14794, partial [Mucuna pruriens]
EFKRNLECGKIRSSSVNWEGLSPKSRYILDIMKELKENLDLVVEALSRAKEEGIGSCNGHSRSSHSSEEERRERHERHRREERCERRYRREEDRRDDLDLGKCKKPQFMGDCMELKVEQLITSFSVQGQKDYALVWWTSLMDDIRKDIEEPCESWYDLKRIMGKRFVPTLYERDTHHKLQSLYQGSRSMEEYHKEMELTLLRA